MAGKGFSRDPVANDACGGWMVPSGSSDELETLVRELSGWIEEKDRASREFKDYQECVDFIKRVRKSEASAKYFKEFPYKRDGTVMREMWFRDPKAPESTKQWVVVHIHYADKYSEDRANRRQSQLVSSITQVNLRHCTVHRTEGHGRTSCYPTLMHGLYLQDRGFPIFRNDTGWNWYRDKISNSTQDGTFQIISKIAEAQMWFPGDPQIIR
mmetsp:Transcript_41063/g.95914  ORF Transcript_41063/g.95914 Transcript_41063/m.95914 type:complete len:212 (+) Transcript_41063:83-718(+)